MKKKTKNMMANEFTIGKISVNYTLQAIGQFHQT